jgi:hypothetical protein
MSKIPPGVKLERLDFIHSNSIPEKHQELIRKYSTVAMFGPVYTANQELLYPIPFVEHFYSEFLPLYEKIKSWQ